METNIIAVKYEDDFFPRTFNGRDYSYFTEKKVSVGDLVIAPTKYGTKIAKVTRINISQEEIEKIRPFMRKITKRLNKDRYINFNEILEEVA